MTIPVSLNTISNLQDTTTAQTNINANSAAITGGFSTALNITGDQMKGNLDMNSNQILNLPSPATANSPARLVDITGTTAIASVPPVGTSGAVVGLLNANNTWSGTNTFSGTQNFNAITATSIAATTLTISSASITSISSGGSSLFSGNVNFTGSITLPDKPSMTRVNGASSNNSQIPTQPSPVTYTPASTCTWVEFEMSGGGGGGCGNGGATSFVDHTHYGGRGGDSYFFLTPAQTVQLSTSATGALLTFSNSVNLVNSQVLWFTNVPGTYSITNTTPYFVVSTPSATSCTFQTFALQQPSVSSWGSPFYQTPLIVTPTSQNTTISVQTFYFGAQGGNGGGIVGDQGNPGSYWGETQVGPDGVFQCLGVPGAAGNAALGGGGTGGAGPYGGAGNSEYGGNGGSPGVNLTGAGGGGASLPNGATTSLFGGTGGGAGGFLHGMFKNPGTGIMCFAGAAGSPGTFTSSGFNGGTGGTGVITFWEH